MHGLSSLAPQKVHQRVKVRINTEVVGEPAVILMELKSRGLVRDNTDAVTQGLMALYEKVLKRDLARMRLRLEQEAQP